jgi:predicted ATPase
MRRRLTDLLDTGAVIYQPLCLLLLADAYGKVGQPEVGLHAIAEAFAIVAEDAQSYLAAELHRLQGELLLRQNPIDMVQAERQLQQALAIGQCQQAKAWELRAAMSLARLWQRQGKRDAAHAVLEPVYGWFTEGFDTADLREAKTLLAALVH